MNRFLKQWFFQPLRSYFRDLRKQQLIREYEGDAVLCPVCESPFRSFAPFGTPRRENARCPRCGSLERHRLIFLFLKKEKDILPPAHPVRLLHFAPPKFFLDRFSGAKNIDYYPCDLFPELYGKNVFQMDITDIRLEDNFFDVILCNHVLEHIPDDAKAMSELYRVMKPGGWGIFQVPVDYSRATTYEDFSITRPKDREKAFGQHDHVRWYGRDFKDRLAKAGFKVSELDYVRKFSPEERRHYGLMEGEMIYFCEK